MRTIFFFFFFFFFVVVVGVVVVVAGASEHRAERPTTKAPRAQRRKKWRASPAQHFLLRPLLDAAVTSKSGRSAQGGRGFSLGGAVVLALISTAAHAQSAQEIIAGADTVRNPNDPFRTTSTLTEYASGTVRGSSVLVVYAKVDKISGQFRDLVRYVEPRRDAGKMALLDGAVLWFYDPASKASVRISPQQHLIGQAPIGDVLTVNLALDSHQADAGGSPRLRRARGLSARDPGRSTCAVTREVHHAGIGAGAASTNPITDARRKSSATAAKSVPAR